MVKLTNRRRSEKTSRLGSLGDGAGLTLPSGGVISPALEGVASMGRDGELWFGVLRADPAVIGPAGGSISSDDKNEVVSSSLILLVIAKNVSKISFCSAFETPLRSMT